MSGRRPGHRMSGVNLVGAMPRLLSLLSVAAFWPVEPVCSAENDARAKRTVRTPAWRAPSRETNGGVKVRSYRAQSPGYDSESAMTGGAPQASGRGAYSPTSPSGTYPPSGGYFSANGAQNSSQQGSGRGFYQPSAAQGFSQPNTEQGYFPSGGVQAGQVPLGRTGPDSLSGSGSSRYPAAGYGGGVPGRPVQYSPGPAPGTNGAYGPGTVAGGYANTDPNQADGQPSPYRPASPFMQPGGGAFQPGPLGPQGPPPGPPGSGFGVPGGAGGLGGPNPPPLGGYENEGGLLPPSNPFDPPPLQVPINVRVQEGQTGRLMFGVGVNSNAGLMGNIVLDEQNFDWRRVPTSWEEIRNATAFRGAGQQFRIEAMPGTVFSRYGFTFREPYLWDTRINFGFDGFYFNRYYQNWTEQRTGARVSFGYQLTPDLSTSLALSGQDVKIFNPTVPTPPELSAVLGNSTLFTAAWTTAHDTRDSPFLPTQGHRISVDLEQSFGTFSFPRAIVGLRQHFLVYERPDGSGKQVINLLNDFGFTGSHTPIYENFFAGGYNTIRGFYFRGASPLDQGVQVGGKFEFLNTVEYMFPITPGDALRGVVFTDFGTVETSTELKWQDFRIAPGFGLRVTIPAMGPAPIALDFAFPVHKAPGDQLQMFNFFVGLQR
ncbi:MAG TPA: BamA/TamA family outer membrane protein [Pirellulales bacterium]|nr:BamA/TamA family outer membrane protein [Pirellulales bacterium]